MTIAATVARLRASFIVSLLGFRKKALQSLFVSAPFLIRSLIRDRARFKCVFPFDKQFQIFQILGPETPVSIEPGVDCLQRLGVELIDAVASAARFHNQMRFTQMTEMLGNGGTGNGKGRCNLPSRLSSQTQQVEKRSSCRISERLKCCLR